MGKEQQGQFTSAQLCLSSQASSHDSFDSSKVSREGTQADQDAAKLTCSSAQEPKLPLLEGVHIQVEKQRVKTKDIVPDWMCREAALAGAVARGEKMEVAAEGAQTVAMSDETRQIELKQIHLREKNGERRDAYD